MPASVLLVTSPTISTPLVFSHPPHHFALGIPCTREEFSSGATGFNHHWISTFIAHLISFFRHILTGSPLYQVHNRIDDDLPVLNLTCAFACYLISACYGEVSSVVVYFDFGWSVPLA